MVTRLNSTFVSKLVFALLSALVTDLNFRLVTRRTNAQKWSAALPTSIGWRILHYFQECLNHHFPPWSRHRMRVNGYQIPPGSIIAQEYNMYRVNGYQIPAQRKVNNCPSRRPSRLKILSVYRMGRRSQAGQSHWTQSKLQNLSLFFLTTTTARHRLKHQVASSTFKIEKKGHWPQFLLLVIELSTCFNF